MKINIQLTPEEKLAYEFAHHWRDREYRPDLQNVDWQKLARLLINNRMSVLGTQIFGHFNAIIPPGALTAIHEQEEKYKRTASKLADALTTYLHSASERNIESIVLKGLWLCDKIYQNISMRPGADIDILVPINKVEACLTVLKQQGIGEYWPNLLHDDYFTRHHLHQQRSTPDLNIWFEIHWALDHPYTVMTIDYQGIFQRAHSAELLGAPIQEMSAPDLLLSLAIHLVKHAVYLPSLIDHDDLPRIILADGMLMYYLDIAEVLKQNKNMDWELTTQLAHTWGVVNILGSVLRVCKRYFDAPVPTEVLSALPVSGPWPVTKRLMARAAEQELAAYEARPVSRFWELLLASNGAFILRPVRMLEMLSYFFPPDDFLRRRYGKANLIIRILHLLRATWQSLRFGWDTFYFGIERYFRLKRLGKRTSLFNKLETDL